MDDKANLKPFLAKIAIGNSLSEIEARDAFEIIMSGDATPAQTGAFLMGLRVKGETVEEITGAVRVMCEKALHVPAPPGAIDIVGTGGDASGTYNISTAAALVVAAAGVPVAKHGNRALSSKCGSADVLASLGVNIDAEMTLVEKAINEAGIGFLMAPRHHAAMRHVAGPRVEIATRTVFNLLGPLSNPAKVKQQITGVFAQEWIEPMAQVLGKLGTERAWVVHGADGLDELSTTGPTYVAALKNGSVSTFEVFPEDANIPRAQPQELKGGDPKANAAAISALLDGTHTAFRDAVLFNAAAALVVAGRVNTLADGAAEAADAIDSGRAKTTLTRLIEITTAPS
jgi:anthranilate phosphoribosyltransferase